MTLAAPFVLCIILDLIAYGIVRTLHLSMSSHRVPRSPPPANMPLGVHSPHFESEHRENFVSLTPSSDQFGEAANGESEVRRTKPGRRKQASFEVAESTAEIPVTQRSRQPRSQETKQNTLYMSKKTSIDRETPS
ncbi:hypothetical protein BCR39DRAFT_112233 [Naematelia encephala]|uniref:Uncharacterized protein n=1 Tax=Naematelia encephala TaxID=71784 RepID=A0A1Y2B6X3_9TREE|nr:hypothetical protein BCR39DRAFT_112233 [Naematelia encephala]